MGRSALFLVLPLFLGACATSPDNDPLEKINRAVFDANQKLDTNALLPVAKAYVRVVPEPARDAIHNFTDNLKVPVTFANDLLQGEIHRAGQSFYRFGVNSTLGVGGFIDIASIEHVPAHTEDLGQTLAVYGVKEGPYLVLPLLGPSDLRDATGDVVDTVFDPISYITFPGSKTIRIVSYGMGAIDRRSRNINNISQLEQVSSDLYATARSAYRQHRDSEIRNGQISADDMPDF